MIDPLVALAFALNSNKGAYAVLLGSGVSRSAGIPTGWEVVCDLTNKVACAEGKACDPSPEEWFRTRFNAEPDYSVLLDALAANPAERQQLLRGYFEPTVEEREQGLKSPTVAHKAIAQMAADGYIRVILTTNFDRLMERALDEVGVAPTVLSTPDQIEGSLPLAHSGVTIIKLHGDYLDTRIKNTDGELSDYGARLNRRLDQIFDEYGLIVCGWSGDWDHALRSAIERCPARRFSTFWSVKGTPSNRASDLIQRRAAKVVPIENADLFFTSVAEKLKSLGDLSQPHPLSSKMAVATMKRYLVDPSARIRLHDLMAEITEKVCAQLSNTAFPASAQLEHADELNGRLSKYEAVMEMLIPMMITGCYWGDDRHVQLWTKVLQRIAGTAKCDGGLTYLVNLRRYPAFFIFYASGIAALASGNLKTFASLSRTKVWNSNEESDAIMALNHWEVFYRDIAKLIRGNEKNHTPASDYMFSKLRAYFVDLIPDDRHYEECFNRMEFLIGMIFADTSKQPMFDNTNAWRGPYGRFVWRGRYENPDLHVIIRIGTELHDEKGDWPLLKTGLFGGSHAQAENSYQMYKNFLSAVGSQMH